MVRLAVYTRRWRFNFKYTKTFKDLTLCVSNIVAISVSKYLLKYVRSIIIRIKANSGSKCTQSSADDNTTRHPEQIYLVRRVLSFSTPGINRFVGFMRIGKKGLTKQEVAWWFVVIIPQKNPCKQTLSTIFMSTTTRKDY